MDSSRLDGCQQTLDVERIRPQTTRRQSVTETRSIGFVSRRRCLAPSPPSQRLPPPRRSEQAIFDELAGLCVSPGFVHAIAVLCWRDVVVRFSDEVVGGDIAQMPTPSSLIRTEITTLIGLMMRGPIDFAAPEPQTLSGYLERSEQLLAELHQAMLQPAMGILRTQGNRPADVNPFSSGQFLREAIFYGAESAYPFQYCDLAPRKYEGDARWLVTNRGLDLEVGRQLCRGIGEVLGERLLATADSLRDRPPAEWTILPGFMFSCEELAGRTGSSVGVVRAFLDAFTLPATERNKGFTSIGEFNSAYTYPLIRKNSSEYLLFQYFGMVEALYDVPFYWMNEDKEYSSTASVHRGNFVETFAAERLSAVFGKHRVYRNVEIKKSKSHTLAEIDVLVIFGDRVIVVQAKSKRLTLLARKGNDRALQQDFKGAVQDGVDQCMKCAKLLTDTSVVLQTRSGGPLELRARPRSVFPIALVADHYPALAFQARQFLTVEATEGIAAPIVIDVFALDSITEMLESPLRLLSYIDFRARFGDKLTANHENMLLSYHLSRNLWLGSHINLLWVQDEVSGGLDAAMYVRREGLPGAATPEGILTKFRGTWFGRIVREIENVADRSAIALGLLLLELSEETIEKLNGYVKEVLGRTVADGALHDVSIFISGASTGLTVHSSTLQAGESARRLASHCSLRKYRQRADRWFGVAVRQDGALTLVVEVTGEWEENVEMERVIEGLPLRAAEEIGDGSTRWRE